MKKEFKIQKDPKIVKEVSIERLPNETLRLYITVIESGLNKYSTYLEIRQIIIEKIIDDMFDEIEELKKDLREKFKYILLK